MAIRAEVRTETGKTTYEGQVICRGPSAMKLILTAPFPLTSIISQSESTRAA